MKLRLNPLIYPVSTSCNLACDYCFHRNKVQDDFSKRLDYSIFEKFFIEWLELLPEKGDFDIIWHGGEPTLRGIEFYEMVAYLVSSHSTNERKLTNCIQTNGVTITEEWADFIRDNHFNVGLSIDGPKKLHDSYRKTRAGKGSFEDISKAMNIFRNKNISFGVVIVINGGNVLYPKEIFEFMKEQGIKKVQLSPCMEIGKGNDESPYSVALNQFASFICKLFDLWVAEGNPKISIGYIDDIVDSILGEEYYNCILSDRCHDFIVLDWNGDILPCETLFNKKVCFGNIIESSLKSIVINNQGYYKKISEVRMDKCKSCEWFSLCQGGCPYHWPSMGEGKTSFCESNKKIFKHIASSIKDIYSVAANSYS